MLTAIEDDGCLTLSAIPVFTRLITDLDDAESWAWGHTLHIVRGRYNDTMVHWVASKRAWEFEDKALPGTYNRIAITGKGSRQPLLVFEGTRMTDKGVVPCRVTMNLKMIERIHAVDDVTSVCVGGLYTAE